MRESDRNFIWHVDERSQLPARQVAISRHSAAPGPSQRDGPWSGIQYRPVKNAVRWRATVSLRFSEQAALRHYLECLRTQTLQAVAASFDETIKRHQQWLDGAEALIDSLSASGIRGQMRDFADSIDVNRAALLDLASTRGPVLRRRWATL